MLVIMPGLKLKCGSTSGFYSKSASKSKLFKGLGSTVFLQMGAGIQDETIKSLYLSSVKYFRFKQRGIKKYA